MTTVKHTLKRPQQVADRPIPETINFVAHAAEIYDKEGNLIAVLQKEQYRALRQAFENEARQRTKTP